MKQSASVRILAYIIHITSTHVHSPRWHSPSSTLPLLPHSSPSPHPYWVPLAQPSASHPPTHASCRLPHSARHSYSIRNDPDPLTGGRSNPPALIYSSLGAYLRELVPQGSTSDERCACVAAQAYGSLQLALGFQDYSNSCSPLLPMPASLVLGPSAGQVIQCLAHKYPSPFEPSPPPRRESSSSSSLFASKLTFQSTFRLLGVLPYSLSPSRKPAVVC